MLKLFGKNCGKIIPCPKIYVRVLSRANTICIFLLQFIVGGGWSERVKGDIWLAVFQVRNGRVEREGGDERGLLERSSDMKYYSVRHHSTRLLSVRNRIVAATSRLIPRDRIQLRKREKTFIHIHTYIYYCKNRR